MPAPTNRQEFPEPHPNWRGANEVDTPQRSMTKIARLWAPLRAVLEPPFATLCRYAHRLVDRKTGIPYSADELKAWILEEANAPRSVTSGDIVTEPGIGSAAPGKLGESLGSGASFPIGSDIPVNAGTLTLTPGDWDVTGVVTFTEIMGPVASRRIGFSTASATLPAFGVASMDIPTSGLIFASVTVTLPRSRFSVSANTPLYLVAKATFSGGSMTYASYFTARRVR